MDPSLTKLIDWSIRIGFGLLGFFAIAWLRDLVTAIKANTTATAALTTTVAVYGERLDQHDLQLKGIWDGKNCLNEGCPLRPVKQVIHPRTQP